jgi:helix-turn-helix protein
VADAASTARTMWTLFEPVHAVTYFTADSRSAYEQAGLRGFWRGYFAGRAAPLGPVSAAVVTASFFNFAPAFVARAIPGVWELITPEEALRARLEGAVAALRGLLAGRESEASATADLLWRAVGELDFPGRVLSAANAALPVPGDGPSGGSGSGPGSGHGSGPGSGPSSGPGDEPGAGSGDGLARLWQAATVLREHRGDGHFAALAAADIDGCEAVALRCLMDMRRENLQPVRGWTDEAWDDALARLAARGWVDGGGALTSAGREAHAAVENATDWAAARPWARLGPEATAEIAAALTPISQACATVLPFPSPIGLPAPRAAG